MIERTRHTGLVVENLDRALKFYRDILGLKVWRREFETDGSYIEKLVGIPGVKVEWAKLQVPDGTLVELLQYHSHPEKNPGAPYPSNRHGASHIAFTVENLEELHRRLVTYGIHCNSGPLTSPDGKVKVIYCHDYDGIILELVEELKTPASREAKRVAAR